MVINCVLFNEYLVGFVMLNFIEVVKYSYVLLSLMEGGVWCVFVVGVGMQVLQQVSFLFFIWNFCYSRDLICIQGFCISVKYWYFVRMVFCFVFYELDFQLLVDFLL